jgi:thiol:disulfide interchange protein
MSLSRRTFCSLLAATVVTLSALPAQAAPQPWNEKAFQAAQAAGKPVLVDVYASW